MSQGNWSAVIKTAELAHEFKFSQEARELFIHSNGVYASPSLLPMAHEFASLEVRPETRLQFSRFITKDMLTWEPPHYGSLPGAPCQVLLIFEGQLGIGVECGPIGNGAVMYVDDDCNFYWIARSLTEYLNRLCDYEATGLIEWQGKNPSISGHPVGIAREPELKKNSHEWGKWRWDE